MEDRYFTIANPGEGKVTVKMSRFLSFAFQVSTAEEARAMVKDMTNAYHDARHVCWAYMLGPERKDWMANDNGEPSGTAGRPILGRINSAGLTDVLVIVVRYFGGIKLGTPGLIAAYGEAAEEALKSAGTRECFQTEDFAFTYPYVAMNDVMKVVKGVDAEVVERNFDNSCSIKLRFRKSDGEMIRSRLLGIDGVTASE